MKKALILPFLILSLIITPFVNASNPNQPVAFDGAWFGQQNVVVEEQSDQHWPPDPLRFNPDWLHYVINPISNCKWNGDDNAQRLQTNRVLGANQTATGSYCKVFQSSSHYVCINNDCESWNFSEGEGIGFEVYSASSKLEVTLQFVPQNKTFTLLPKWDSSTKTYIYGGVCVNINYLKDDPTPQFIPGSNGSTDPASIEGTGVITSIIPSIRNPTSRAVKNIAWQLTALGASQVNDSVCVNGAPAYTTHNTDYPFKWYTP